MKKGDFITEIFLQCALRIDNTFLLLSKKFVYRQSHVYLPG